MAEEKKVILETTDGEKIELNVQKEAWYKKAWNKTKEATSKIVDVVSEHPIATLILVTTAINGTCKIMNSTAAIKRANTQAEALNRGKLEYYDRRRDLYYSLRRPMTNSENMEFSRRKREGEDAGEILADMNLI